MQSRTHVPKLLAVNRGGANLDFMLIFAITLAASAPVTLSETNQRDIACVAVIGLHANGQRHKWEGYDEVPNVQESGKKWAGIVGERVMKETGLPQELIGFAITEAANAEQGRVNVADEPRAVIYARLHDCLPLMEADLAADEMANKPLPKPQ